MDQVFTFGCQTDAISVKQISDDPLIAVGCSETAGYKWDGEFHVLKLCDQGDDGLGAKVNSIYKHQTGSGTCSATWCGNSVLSGGDDGRILLHTASIINNALTVYLQTNFFAHYSCVSSLSSSVSSNFAISSSFDGKIKQWDLEHLKANITFDNRSIVHCVKLNPINNSSVAGGLEDGTVRLFDLRSPKMMNYLKLDAAALALDWMEKKPNALVVGTELGFIMGFDDRSTRTPLFCHQMHSSPIRSIGINCNDDSLLVGCNKGLVSVLTTGNFDIHLQKQFKLCDVVRCVSWIDKLSAFDLMLAGCWDNSLSVAKRNK